MTDSLAQTLDKLRVRRDELERVLPVHIFVDQRHLDMNTSERDYWHYGYLVALRDALDLLETRQ